MLVPGIQRMATGLSQEFLRLRSISQNQANLETPGFKQTLAGLRQGTMDQWRDDQEGPVVETSRGLDIRPPSGTYFEIEKNGRTLLTRRGDLRMDDAGYLVVGSGERILNSSGAPIKVSRLDQVSIDGDGQVRDKGKVTDQIRRVRVSAVNELGGTLYSAKGDAKITEDRTPIDIGVLDGSNADLTRNQTDLVATIQRARIFTNAASLQDQTVDRAIRAMLGN